MYTHIALLALLTVPAPGTRYPVPPLDRPRIEVWTDRGDAAVYTRGERVRVYFSLDRDAYVTVFRVDTDGRVRVLFPRDPWEDNFARGGREFEVESHSSGSAFAIEDYPGVGYVFAVVSADPFVYDDIESGDHWDYRVIAAGGRVRGDPYVALTDLAERIVPQGYADWDYDLVSYSVERHYSYPRFLCYDCHTYVSYPYWDPYYASCVRFRIVVYDDPWYYPYRRYGGTRVVFVRPHRPQPRFIFKDWGGNQPTRDGFVTRERERPVNDNGRRGVTGRDVGGIGVIPPPNVRDRRERPDQPVQPDQPSRPEGRGRTDPPDRRDRPDRAEPPRRPGGQVPDRPQVLPPARDTRPQTVREPRRDNGRVEPRRDSPRAEPRRDPPRAEPRRDPPRAEPRRDPPRAEPRRDPPRAEPRRESSREKPRSEPELRRRKP